AEGNVWAIDGDAKEGKGNQVFKLSPDGRVLMTLGKAGQGGKGPDVFDRPTGIAFARNGDIFISEGHAPSFGNSRIVKFNKDGKFITNFRWQRVHIRGQRTRVAGACGSSQRVSGTPESLYGDRSVRAPLNMVGIGRPAAAW